VTGGPEVLVVPDEAEGAAVVADRLVSVLGEAASVRGRADWVTGGGSTVVSLYRRLAGADPDRMPWSAIHVWWGDDRYVPADHPLSNVKPFADIVLDIGGREEGVAGVSEPGVPLPVDHIHPFPIGEAIGRGAGPAWAAGQLADALRAEALPMVDGRPALDVMLLGVGPDGHVLSIFPGSAAFDTDAWAIDVPAPSHIEPRVARVTLHPSFIGAARHVIVVAYGAAKADVVGRVLETPDGDPRELPARLAARPGATWILDEAAAANLAR
jgi:6-phosphogluconolactonase